MWIEIHERPQVPLRGSVTPLAGVWIEISDGETMDGAIMVTPLAGVWIEMTGINTSLHAVSVTPLAGVWIEILHATHTICPEPSSLPLRECGLKYVLPILQHPIQ